MGRMRWSYLLALFLLGFLALLGFLSFGHAALLSPAGIIAASERTLMIHATLLMLIVIVPVLVLTFFFAWQYRAGNTKAVYQPEWEHSRMDELVWWAIPLEIVLVLGALTWTSTHELDPRKPLDEARGKPPITIQVVALDWKWLFIYPEERIATVNFVEIPVGRPIKFSLTADAPMNSFWIPQLGGQIYAMPGMINSLYLEADRAGDFSGGSANYSGDGFAKMKFTVRAVQLNEFDAWVSGVRQSPNYLSKDEYSRFAAPSENSAVAYYGRVDNNLYSSIVGKYKDFNSTTHQH